MQQEYAEKEEIMSQQRRMLASSFEPSNGAIITALLLFSTELRLVCTKTRRIVECTPCEVCQQFLAICCQRPSSRRREP